jgi:magnesium transporter
MHNPKLQALSVTVAKLLHRRAENPLTKILSKRHPVEIAYFFRDLTPKDSKLLFEYCGNFKTRAEVLVELDMRDQLKLITSIEKDIAAKIFKYMDNDDLTDLIEEMDDEIRNSFLELMKEEDQETLEELLSYDSATAGGLMNPSFLCLSPNTTTTEAINKIRVPEEDYATTFYIYIVNSAEQLAGVISLRQLVTCKPETLMKDIMTPEVISVPASMDQEEVAEIVDRYGFLAIPVVDEDNRMMGVVTIDDVIEVIREEATEDIFKMAGAGEDILYFQAPFIEGLLPRLKKLLFPLVGGIGASLLLLNNGKELLGPGIVLLFLLPVIILLSHIIATQTSTLIVRGFAMNRIGDNQFMRVLGREMLTGLVLGFFMAIAVAGISSLPFLNFFTSIIGWKFAIVTGIISMAALSLSAFIGAFIPLIYKRMQLDPASGAGSTVLVLVDILDVSLILFGNTILLSMIR